MSNGLLPDGHAVKHLFVTKDIFHDSIDHAFHYYQQFYLKTEAYSQNYIRVKINATLMHYCIMMYNKYVLYSKYKFSKVAKLLTT